MSGVALRFPFADALLGVVRLVDMCKEATGRWPRTTEPANLVVDEVALLPPRDPRDAAMRRAVSLATRALAWQRINPKPLTLACDAAFRDGRAHLAVSLAVGAPECRDDCVRAAGAGLNPHPVVLCWQAPMPPMPDSVAAERAAVRVACGHGREVARRLRRDFALSFPDGPDGHALTVWTDCEAACGDMGDVAVRWRRGRTGLVGKAAHEVATTGLAHGPGHAEHAVARWALAADPAFRATFPRMPFDDGQDWFGPEWVAGRMATP